MPARSNQTWREPLLLMFLPAEWKAGGQQRQCAISNACRLYRGGSHGAKCYFRCTVGQRRSVHVWAMHCCLLFCEFVLCTPAGPFQLIISSPPCLSILHRVLGTIKLLAIKIDNPNRWSALAYVLLASPCLWCCLLYQMWPLYSAITSKARREWSTVFFFCSTKVFYLHNTADQVNGPSGMCRT